jgi:hypothetical protein
VVAAEKLIEIYNDPDVRAVVDNLQQASWIDEVILAREREKFLRQTQVEEILPAARLQVTLPGKYDALLHHISVHRWYLGEQRQQDVSYAEALRSWYDNVYLPIAEIIREQQMLDQFPRRTETDLYLWVMENRPAVADMVTA